MKLKGLHPKDLWWFSVPSIIASVFEPLASVVDTALVGHIGERSLAALAVSVAVFNAITWMFNFLVHISTQSIADYSASKDPELLRSRLKISLTLAVMVGLSCSLILYLPHEFWFKLGGGSDDLMPLIKEYFFPRIGFHAFTVLSITILSILRGFGRLKLVLYLMIFSTGLNIALSWFLLYPMEMGLAGAAWGTVTAHVLVTLVGLYFVFDKKEIREGFFKAKVVQGQWLHFGKNSLDMFGRSFTLTLCFFSSTKLAGMLGVRPLGAHQVLLQVWLLASFFLDGLAITGNILGARFYFGDKVKRTAIVFDQLLKLGLYVGIAFTVGYGLFWEQVVSLFVESAGVKELLMDLKWPIVISQIISSIAFVYDGLIFGLNGFPYLRKQMMIGALVTYVPLALTSLYYPDMKWIWWGLIILNGYRLCSGYYYIQQKVFKKV